MEDKELNKSYYAVIPANVRYDADLTANAKLLYGEITALCNEKGYCWASNNYFSKLYNVSKTSISKWINSLVEKGYIKRNIIFSNESKQILNRYLTIVIDPIKEKLNRGIEQKFKDNNTINNTINNTFEYTTTYSEEDLVLKNQVVKGKNESAMLFISNAQISELNKKITKEEADYYLSKMLRMLADGYEFGCSHYQFIIKMASEDKKL